MENQNKKFSFSESSLTTKIVYAVVLLTLVASAVVIGIVAAKNKNKTPAGDNSIVMESPKNNTDTDTNKTDNKEDEKQPQKEALTFVSPCIGSVMTEHSLTVPVFSDTLGEWRVHSGIDIATEDAAPVYAAAPGIVSAVYADPLMGTTVEITHSNNFKTVYSNLQTTLAGNIGVGTEVKSGDLIGNVGDTSLKELADEAHLHFGMKINDVAVNPLDYLSDGAKEASLGENPNSLSA